MLSTYYMYRSVSDRYRDVERHRLDIFILFPRQTNADKLNAEIGVIFINFSLYK